MCSPHSPPTAAPACLQFDDAKNVGFAINCTICFFKVRYRSAGGGAPGPPSPGADQRLDEIRNLS